MRLRYLKIITCILFAFANTAGWTQVSIDTDEIESVIDEWNFANNERNLHSLERVYADRLTYYTREVTKSQAIALKRQMFNTKPWFRQRIVTEVTYKPYSKGVVKCDFTKEIFEKTKWKKYPSYLLVSYERRHYVIVGESDYSTDTALEYKPNLGKPIILEKPAIPRNERPAVDSAGLIPPTVTAPTDSAFAMETMPEAHQSDITPEKDRVDTAQIAMTMKDLPLIFSDPASLGVISIPRGYIIILVGILGLGGLMIFVADSVQSRKVRRQIGVHRHDEAEHVVRNFKIQASFEAFVTTLFDPLYFRHRRVKTDHVLVGKGVQAERGPDLMFDFVQKDMQARFAVKCQYYRHVAKNEVQLFDEARQHHFRQFEEESDMDVYYVLGFGGTPDDPRELYFIPAKDVKSEYMSKGMLRRYSKSGMFFYNKKTGTIQ